MAELEIRSTGVMRARVYLVIAIAGALTLLLCALLAGGGANLFIRRATIVTYLPDATGLDVESDVRLDGLHVGDVTKLEISGILDPQRAVRVVMRVQHSFLRSIPSDSQTAVDEDTLVGYQFITISAGKSAIPVADKGTLHSAPIKPATNQADLIEAIEADLTQVDEALVVMSSGETKLGKLMVGTREYSDAAEKIAAFQRSIAAFAAPQSPAGQMIYSTAMYDRIHDVALRADQTLANIQTGQGGLGQFVASDEQYTKLANQLSQLRSSLADMNAGKGPYASLLADDADYQKIVRLLTSTDQLIDSLTRGDGRLSELLGSAQLYESLNGSVQAIDKLLKDINANPQKYLRMKVF